MNAHIPLVSQWKATSKSDHSELSRICVEMLGIFNRAFPKQPRSAWQKRHSASYNYAIGKGIIPKALGSGSWLNRDQAPNNIALIAKARDVLHEYCCLYCIPYAAEWAGGEVLKQQIQAGKGYNESLDMAKRVAKDGV
jgi:hypothetical protein